MLKVYQKLNTGLKSICKIANILSNGSVIKLVLRLYLESQ